MFNLSRKNISIFHRISYMARKNAILFIRVRCISSTCSDPSQSFAYSYLIENIGFSKHSALMACKYLHFKNPDKPNSVIEFLEKHGFSKSQIQQIIRYRPQLLYSNVENSILPKMEFFLSRGVLRPDLIKLLFGNPTIFSRSLENQIVPCFNYLSNLLQSDENAVKAIKRYPHLVTCNFEALVSANVNILLENGVPESNIRTMFVSHPRSFVMTPDQFKEIVKEVKKMGFHPLDMKFLRVVIMFRKMSKPVLERKFNVFKKFGWSEQVIWDAIRNNPQCVDFSEETIMATMDFLVNSMGFKPLLIANQPSVLRRSLEKRIIPRGLYAQELWSKGLMKKFTLSGLFDTSEKVFVQTFVKSPKLLKLYKEKMELHRRQI